MQFDYANYNRDDLINLIHETQDIMAEIIPIAGSNSGEPIDIVCQAKGLVQDYKYVDAGGRHWFAVLTDDDNDRDPMSPDYAALAAEEPVSQIRDSCDSAEI